MKEHDDRDSQWFIFKGEQHRGPYQTDEMVNLFALGVIGPKDLVWREGGGTWLPFSDQDIFRQIIFKEDAKAPLEVERPPLEVPMPSLHQENVEVEMPEEESYELPPLPPMPDEVDEVLEVAPVPVKEHFRPEVEPEIEPEEEVEEFEEEELELEEETQNRSWGTIIALGAAGIAVLVSMLWFFQFQLQTYDLIGLESAAVEQFNAVILEKKRDHLIHFTKDGNVLWAAAPDIIEGEAYLKLQSVAGRALSSEPLEIVSQGKLVQALVPFQRFSFHSGQNWVDGDYTYQLAIRPKGTIARLASFLSPYPFFKTLGWVKNHTRGHTFNGQISRHQGSSKQFEEDLVAFKQKMWDSLSKPLQNRLEKYQTLKQLAEKTRELWLQRLSVAVTWRAFKKYDEGYARDIAPVLQSLVVDSIRISNATIEQSPLSARLFQEIEETGKQLGELASVMSKSSKAVRQYRNNDKVRLRTEFQELWQPLIQKIDARIASLESEISKLKSDYKLSE